MRKLLLLLLLATSSVGMAGDFDFSLGGVFSASQSPYKDHDNTILGSPMILYDGPHLYAKGASAGVHVFKNEIHKVSVGLGYSFLHFNPKDTDDQQLRRLDKRRSSLMGEVSYTVITPIGLGKIKLGRDLFGHSDGYVADFSYSAPYVGEKLIVAPSLGVQWTSSKFSDYYYGVTERESGRSGVRQHSVAGNLSPYASVEAIFKITDRWSAVAGGSVQWLTSKVKDSPMVDRSFVVGGFLGGLFVF